MDDQERESLFRQTEEAYGKSFKSDLIEQYKLYVQSVENASARRISSSRYLLTVNAALVAAYGFQSAGSGQVVLALPVALAGIAISVLAFHIIRSHRNLNRVKFDIIHELEARLPADLYAHEWRMLEEGRGKVYRPVPRRAVDPDGLPGTARSRSRSDGSVYDSGHPGLGRNGTQSSGCPPVSDMTLTRQRVNVRCKADIAPDSPQAE